MIDKKKFKKGLINVLKAMFFAFTGPVIVQQAFQNKDHEFYLYVLIIGLLLLMLSVFFGFLGIITIVNAVLNNPKQKDS
ncbi:MAG: hypothetical protein CMC79_01305 [Flavobacteriaceae bacterium]|nr:hypothetical protein [Flavobacteriaceae bacterium]|tara:strand:- start:8205 stop:8441 length:237 start_codon:yes stop_codon:yes gene_type:complete